MARKPAEDREPGKDPGRRIEDRYQALYNETPIMMHSIDPQGRLTSVNDYWLHKLGYERDEVLGRSFPDFLTAESRDYALNDALPKFFASGSCKDVVYQMVTRDGQILDILLSATSERDEAGRTLMSRAMILDVTESKRAAAEREVILHQLEEKNAELERFVYTVSHDLKSPLVTIRGFIGLLERDAVNGDLDRMRKDIARIENAAETMQQLLDELLHLSRIGHTLDPKDKVDLGILAGEVVELLSGSLSEAAVEVEIAADMPTVLCDRLRMHEVVQNLIENAIKFMGDQAAPRIVVGQRRQGSETVIFVRDNGGGVDPRYQEKIFGLFDQMDAACEGTGVGLALARRIVEGHGGRIWVESEGAGSGSRFCFTLAGGDPSIPSEG